MYRNLNNAIKAEHEVILTLVDKSKITGVPSWGEDRTRVKIKSPENVVWIPLDEIQHVTTLLSFSM